MLQRKTLTIINWVCTIYDTARELFLVFTDPNTSGVDVLSAAARGILTGILINGLCKMAYIGPIIKAAVKAGAVYGQVESIIDATKDGHYDLVVVRIVQFIIDIISLLAACFTGDTLVAAEDGQKRIDKIEAGDKVWAYDIFTGETELKKVLTVYVHDDVTEILHLHTTSGDVDTTTNHPFYVSGRGWVAAGDLNVGDEAYLIDGSAAYVTGAELERFTEPVKVYNLEVADIHTYFVGDKAVLVHNNYNEPSPALEDSPYNPQAVEDRIKPPYQSNPQHNSHSSTFKPDKTPEPFDAASAYEGAYRGNMYTWYGRGEEGIYRYFDDNAGHVHFSGIMSGSELQNIPNWIRKVLEIVL